MEDFEILLKIRGAQTYADFATPLIADDAIVLDCGTGAGSIAVGLAEHVKRGRVIAIDKDPGVFSVAQEYCETHGVKNLVFQQTTAERLPFPDRSFDVVYCHSMFELLDEPKTVLAEFYRILKPQGLIAVAAVEYSGVILTGIHEDKLVEFYRLKELSWGLQSPAARPRLGSQLRGVLIDSGFSSVRATATYISYGDEESIRDFGLARSAECQDEEFAKLLVDARLTTLSALDQLADAWRTWAIEPTSFMAFPWCRAVGFRLS